MNTVYFKESRIMKKIIISLFVLASVTGYAQKSSTPLDRSKRPAPGAAPVIKLGDIPSFQLPNGLKVFIVENHKLPTVKYSLVLNVRPQLEKEAVGTATITGELLTSGTKNRTKDQLDKEVDFIGAYLSTYSEGLNAGALKKHQNKLLELISDVVVNADFKQEELDKIKNQTLSSLATEKDEPDAIAKNVRSVLNYGKAHYYGEIQTEESVGNITLEKCNNYYKTYFRPNVAYLAVVGDVTLAEIKPLIEKYLGSWQKAEVPVANYPKPTAPAKTRLAIVNKAGAVQSVLNVTYPLDLKPGSDDAIKARVMNAILGGGSSARLFVNLREKHGYTYGAYSTLSSDELVGNFNAFAKVRNAVSDSSITELLFELNRLKTQNVSKDELEGIKNFLSGQFAIDLEEPSAIAKFAINIERYHLPRDYYSNYLKKLAAVTVDDVYAMAQKYIRPDNATILVVGDKDELSKKLERFANSQPIAFYDNYGNPIKEQAAKTVSSDITPQKVLASYIDAIGGMNAITKIKDVTSVMNANFQGRALTVITQQKAPNKYAMSINMGQMLVQKDVYDGTKGKQKSLQGKSELTGESLERMKAEATLFIETQYEKLGYKLNLAGIENVNGKDAYKLEVVSPTGHKSTEYYDVASGLKIRTIRTTEVEKQTITEISDCVEYKQVEGVKFPSVIATSGAMSLKLVAEKIEVNKGVDDTAFSID